MQNKNLRKEIKYLLKVKTHFYSINKINKFIYKGYVVERQYNDVSIDFYFNNELIHKDNKRLNPLLIEGGFLNIEVIKLLKRDNEWQELNYDQFVFHESSISFLQRKNLYNNYFVTYNCLKKSNIERKKKIKSKQKIFTKFFNKILKRKIIKKKWSSGFFITFNHKNLFFYGYGLD